MEAANGFIAPSFNPRRYELLNKSTELAFDLIFTLTSVYNMKIVLSIFLYFASLGHTTAASAITIYNTTSAFIYVLSIIFLKEKISIVKIFAVILSVVGVALVR